MSAPSSEKGRPDKPPLSPPNDALGAERQDENGEADRSRIDLSSISADPGEDSVARLAGAYADALEQGRGADDSIADRLDRAAPGLVECLQRLERHWPDRSHDEIGRAGAPRHQPEPGDEPPAGSATEAGISDQPDGAPPAGAGLFPGNSDYPPIGHFTIERELGRGGFGVVFLAHDTALRRPVALKVPRLDALLSPEGRERFLREARVTAALDHPHTVPVYEAGQHGPLCYIAFAYCSGPNLAQWLASQDDLCQPDMAAEIILPLAEAVEHAHARGVLHRDLKPSNIMLDAVPEGTDGGLPFVPRLTDFGLAGMFEPAMLDTRSSVVLGTLLYMAPEQLTSGGRKPTCTAWGRFCTNC